MRHLRSSLGTVHRLLWACLTVALPIFLAACKQNGGGGGY